jgi:hypothetical protein
MTALPRGLIVTFAAVSLATLALIVLLTVPRTGLEPQRAAVLELDLPTPAVR